MSLTVDPPAINRKNKSYRDPEICRNCVDFWKSKGKGPRILVELPARGDFGTRMYVCPWCDGPVADNATP